VIENYKGSMFPDYAYPSVSVKDINIVSSIQIVDCTFTIDLKCICGKGQLCATKSGTK
jgi:hypothetical protein